MFDTTSAPSGTQTRDPPATGPKIPNDIIQTPFLLSPLHRIYQPSTSTHLEKNASAESSARDPYLIPRLRL